VATESYFWDSCVFCAYLSDARHAYDIASIDQYLADTISGKCHIYALTLIFGEDRESHLTRSGVGSFDSFFDSLSGAATMITPDVNTLKMAGRFRDITYKKTGGERQMGLGDAVMLASCLQMEDVYGVTIDAFHTYDAGKKRGSEGKCVPILNFEEWCKELSENQRRTIDPIVKLRRTQPIYPQHLLPL
jgi:hypothetical protein